MTTEAAEEAILTYLSASPGRVINDTFPWAAENHLDHAAVVGAVKSLLAEDYVATDDLAVQFYALTEEGETTLEKGSQEVIVFRAVLDAGKMSIPDLQSAVGKDIAKIGMGNCMKNKWLKKDGGDLVPAKELEEVSDEVQKTLQILSDGGFAMDAIDSKVSRNSSSWTPAARVPDAFRVANFRALSSLPDRKPIEEA
jgi:phenylalanyl-tRNA synthetase alpha chain